MPDKWRKSVLVKIRKMIRGAQTFSYHCMFPLLSFAAEHIPKNKQQGTPLYILCTAGMRIIIPESQQEAILEDLHTDIPVHFNFLFSDSHVEIISGKQEEKFSKSLRNMFSLVASVYAWIGINFVLGTFDHVHSDKEAVVEVQFPGSDQQEALVRKRTAGVLDMGSVSTKIAYKVPKTVSFASSQQEEVAKNLLAEFNLGSDAHCTEHVYRVYVSTFLGFGGNAARQRYEDNIVKDTTTRNKLLGQHIGETPESPILIPCLPMDLQDEIGPNLQKLHLRGTGDFDQCRLILQPFLNRTNKTQTSLNGVYQPTIDYVNSQFYGFSEFYYCTEDILEHFDSGLYASHETLEQCFKPLAFSLGGIIVSCSMLVVFSKVQWTLGAILYRTQFLPLKHIQQEGLKGAHSHWRHSFSFVNNHYLFLACFFIVLLSIMLYLMRLRRIHRHAAKRCSPSSVAWLEEGLGSATLPINL
uniref:Ectonucleoside triphosphate diphosphohydrolase 4 n=1 Tax=Cynoglossus semilaevis TaxID=244447 RepID=A0A3P8W5Q8_CYNSE